MKATGKEINSKVKEFIFTLTAANMKESGLMVNKKALEYRLHLMAYNTQVHSK